MVIFIVFDSWVMLYFIYSFHISNNHETQKAMAKSKLWAGAKASIKAIKLDLSKKCLHLNAIAFNLFGL